MHQIGSLVNLIWCDLLQKGPTREPFYFADPESRTFPTRSGAFWLQSLLDGRKSAFNSAPLAP